MVRPIYLFTFIFSFLTPSYADDSAAMAKLLTSFDTAPSGWSATTDYCMWKNVNCDGSNRVTSIDLASQSLTGILPSDLGTLTQLTTLSLRGNSLSGPLPSLANLTSLQKLYLDNNNFTSVPSSFFQGLTSLEILTLSQNLGLEPWTISTELTQATSLVTFYASSANIIGSLPDIFGSFPRLLDLQLSYNNLDGTLPKSLGGSGIQNLWLNNQQNGLSGTIDVLSSMTQLSQVRLHKNQFTGPIPDLSNCTSLFDLQLRDNQFTGLIPASLMSIPSLRNVSLDVNDLQGPYPQFPSSVTTHTLDGINSFCKNTPGPCDPQVTTLLEIASAFGYPIKLANSWTGNNACTSWTFIICDSQGNIITINFAKQQFVGTISPVFAKLTSLRNLYLNDNNLTGSIPDAFTNMTSLQVLDISNNNLTGLIPKFGDSVKLTMTGNPLIGKSTPSSGSGGSSNGTSPSGNTAVMGSSGTSILPGMIVSIVIAVIIFLVVMLLVSIKCYVSRRHRRPTISLKIEVRNIEISIEVLKQATNNFNEDNILGRGGFGVVYKGEYHDGTKVAVKRMESAAMGSKGINEFQAEISVLNKVRHRHLVSLLGCCINENERLLVYEYMPQGSLTQRLFDLGENGCSPLTWKQRIQIAMDVARGMEYLHSLAPQIFIHRDLKPSNILLGNDMRAKVADFGLVKIAPDGKNSLTTRLAGTFGYLAPEYGATGRVTTKADVYAFGVVLMQLITGRKAVDDTLPNENPHLVTWFCKILNKKERIPMAIDQTINPDEETMESIYRVAELAGHCTTHQPYQRPNMGHVVNILSPLVEKWKPTCHKLEHKFPTFHGVEDIYGFDQDMSLPLQRWQTM
ncbi:receptor-like kinase TMK4 [Quercus lobata]|uniref:Protein kinase domain-containing protein n=1 Tax=Quercus lobata TaxID=97700 RepID=A0A7N2M9L5_QUELO|nr:receptor-like kinase TMK4 [Quercus lobata]